MKSKIVYLMALLATIWSCSDEFTEQTAFGSLSDESLKNAQGIELLLVGAYSGLDGMTDTGGADWEKTGDNWWFDVMADDMHKGSTNSDQADLFLLETYDWQTANPYIGNKWRSLYAATNRANAVINQISLVTEGDFSSQLAEARFLRGLFNFEIQKIWGNVPYISEENFATFEFNQPNDGPIWDEIEADLSYAASNLPESQSLVGKPSQKTAQAFLAKAHLYQREYQAAYDILVTLIGKWSLNEEFGNNFRAAGENSSESVFAIQFTADAGLSFNGNRGSTLNFPSGGPIGSCCGFGQPTQDLANAYKVDANGLPLLDDYNKSDIKNDYGVTSAQPFSPETGLLDPRIDYTIGRRGIDFNGWGVMPGKDWIRAEFGDISGPYLTKKNFYWVGDDANRGTGGWGEQRSGINYHFMRYSDVLLMAAEAAAETGNLTEALDWVNEVRNRAKNMTPVGGKGSPAANYKVEPYPSFPSQDYAIKAVRFERRLELATEGHRLFDLRRWGNAAEVMNAYKVNEKRAITSFVMADYQPKHDLCPIPLNAIDGSVGTLKQNPGY